MGAALAYAEAYSPRPHLVPVRPHLRLVSSSEPPSTASSTSDHLVDGDASLELLSMRARCAQSLATSGFDGAPEANLVYQYDDYGTPPAAPPYNPYRFQGPQLDSETGLYHLRNRYMNPALGKFIQKDPAGYGAGMNLYDFAGNDPINKCDPTGLDVMPTGYVMGDNGEWDKTTSSPPVMGDDEAMMWMTAPLVIVVGAQVGGAAGLGTVLTGAAAAFEKATGGVETLESDLNAVVDTVSNALRQPGVTQALQNDIDANMVRIQGVQIINQGKMDGAASVAESIQTTSTLVPGPVDAYGTGVYVHYPETMLQRSFPDCVIGRKFNLRHCSCRPYLAGARARIFLSLHGYSMNRSLAN